MHEESPNFRSLANEIKNTKHDTVGTVLISNRIIVDRGKFDTLTQRYMTTHFFDLVQALQ